MKKKNLAFTLAEVLIVIGIIGVVAALTLPNLNHATGDKEKVTKVKKIYSALTEAVDRAQAIYGPFDTWFNDISEDNSDQRIEVSAKRITEFMKISKDCGFHTGCWSENELLMANGDSYGESPYAGYSIVLTDGTAITFRSVKSYSLRIVVDIDGPNKGKTQMGNDFFDFAIFGDNEIGANANQIYPSAMPRTSWVETFGTPYYMSNYSTAWVIENGNLDYLKCPEELNWETKTSCE